MKRRHLAIIRTYQLAPVELCRALSLKNVENYRRTDCQFVDLCIEVALENKWDGFSCRECTAFQRIPEEAANYQRGDGALASVMNDRTG